MLEAIDLAGRSLEVVEKAGATLWAERAERPDAGTGTTPRKSRDFVDMGAGQTSSRDQATAGYTWSAGKQGADRGTSSQQTGPKGLGKGPNKSSTAKWFPNITFQPNNQGEQTTLPPLFETSDEAVAAIKRFKEVVAQAFQGTGSSSMKFDCERRVADPEEMLQRVRLMLGRDKPIRVQPYEEACGRRWVAPPSHTIYAIGTGDERLKGLRVHIPPAPGRGRATWVAIQVRMRVGDEGPKAVTIQGSRGALTDLATAWTMTVGPLAGPARAEETSMHTEDLGAYGVGA